MVSLHCAVSFLLRRMTFGKVNELGQFIREAEPEPDVKKSKGMILHTVIFIPFLPSFLPVFSVECHYSPSFLNITYFPSP